MAEREREVTIRIRSHHFTVTNISLRARPAILAFIKKYYQFGLDRQPGGRFSRVHIRTYAAVTKDWREFRFHINTLARFREVMTQYYLDGGTIEEFHDPVPESVAVELPVFPSWVSRDYQGEVLDFMIKPEPVSKLVSIQTGKGKSYCAMRTMSTFGKRVVVFIKPMYIDKWISDFKKTFDIEEGDLMVVQGGDQMKGLLLMAEAGLLKAKIIIISNKTMQNYLTLYELHHEKLADTGYIYNPDELCEKLGIGLRLIDEVHQDFHLNFKIDLYTNIEMSISLSATLTSNDTFLEEMYSVAYPMACRFLGQAYHKYVTAKSLIYRFKRPDRIRFKNGGNYSHHVFEQSVIKQPSVLANYIDLIDLEAKFSYFDERQPGQKLLIFCSSIDMCTLVTAAMAKRYSHLDVRRYVEDDPYENVLEADIIVSTMLSAGTALDIPNLITVIMTVSMSSKAGNIQGFGRLREIPGVKLRFIYFVCEDIPKQLAYHEEKKLLLRNIALHYKAEYHRQLV